MSKEDKSDKQILAEAIRTLDKHGSLNPVLRGKVNEIRNQERPDTE